MADKNIEIGIKTTGAQKAAADISLVGQAVDGMQDSAGKNPLDVSDIQADIDALKARAEALKENAEATEGLGDSTAEATPKLDKIGITLGLGGIGAAAAMTGKMIATIAQELRNVDTVELKRIDEQMANQIELAKEWAEAIKNPINALLKLTTGDTVESAFAGMDEQLKLNAKARQDFNDRIMSRGEEDAGRLEKLLDRLEFVNKRAAALAGADDARKDRADAATVAGDPAQKPLTEAGNITREAVEKVRALNDSITPLQAKAESAKKALDAALANETMIQSRVLKGEANQEDLVRARDISADLMEKVSGLQSSIAEQKELVGAQVSEIGDRASQAIETIARDGGEAITEAARAAMDAIRQNAADQGRGTNPMEQEALGAAQRLLDDNTPDAQQGGQLSSILQTLANTLNAKDAKLATSVDGMIRNTKAAISKYESLQKEVEALENRIRQIK